MMNKHARHHYRVSDRNRRGLVLIFTLVILAILSLAAYSFSESMLLEYRAARAAEDRRALHSACLSEIAAMEVALSRDTPSGLNTRIQFLRQLQEKPFSWQDTQGLDYQVEIQRPDGFQNSSVQGGLFDESSRLNLHTLALDPEQALQSRERLMKLPGVTAYAADSILDWIDDDEEPREFGAEAAWYASQGLPYQPRQGAIQSLAELLLVRGVSADAFLGEDQNANGWLDPHEDDGNEFLPADNADHSLDLGWCRFVTVESYESNLNDSGNLKVDLNQPSLGKLYRELEPAVGREAARFIVAMRMYGPLQDEDVLRFDSPEAIKQRRESAFARAKKQISESRVYGNTPREVINGFTIDREGNFKFRSVADLIAQQTEIQLDGTSSIISSPWIDQPQQLPQLLANLESLFTVHAGSRYPSRINLNTADLEVLTTVPGLNRQLASAIIQRRSESFEFGTSHANAAWLYKSGLINLAQLRRMMPYLTSQGDVVSGIAVATRTGAKQPLATRFTIDATGPNAFATQVSTTKDWRSRTKSRGGQQ